jgi:hypothetical protein
MHGVLENASMQRVLVSLTTAFFLAACHDAGADTLAAARTRYDALTKAGTPVASRDFDAVLAQLRAVPAGGRSRAEADALERQIEDARKTPPVVLAAPARSLDEQLAQARIECDGLQHQLPALEGDARKAKLELFDACRRRAAELEAKLAPPPDAGAPGL